MTAGRQACHVRIKSQSVDMELETKPDDYSLEIGDGHGVKADLWFNRSSQDDRRKRISVSLKYCTVRGRGRLSARASGFAQGSKKFPPGSVRLK